MARKQTYEELEAKVLDQTINASEMELWCWVNNPTPGIDEIGEEVSAFPRIRAPQMIWDEALEVVRLDLIENGPTEPEHRDGRRRGYQISVGDHIEKRGYIRPSPADLKRKVIPFISRWEAVHKRKAASVRLVK